MASNDARAHQEEERFQGPSKSASPRRRHAVELGVVTVLVLLLVWRVPTGFAPASAARTVLSVFLFALLAVALLLSWREARPGWLALGLAPRQWRRGWPALAAFTAAAALGLAAFGAAVPPRNTVAIDLALLGRVLSEAAVQQLLMQAYFNNRIFGLTEGLPERRRLWVTVAATAALMVLAHAPNHVVMAVILPAVVFWSWHFRVFRNLPALVLSHLVLGVTLRAAADWDLLLHMTAGLDALRRLGVLCGWYGAC